MKSEIDNVGIPVQWGNVSDVSYGPSVDTLLSMSVIEDIKAEINRIACEEATEDLKWAAGLIYSIKIINKHIGGKKLENDFKYMFLKKGGKAIHQLGDISRDVYNAELIIVNGEDESNWIGHFVEGFGLIDVKFAKDDCKVATAEEIVMWFKDRDCIVF